MKIYHHIDDFRKCSNAIVTIGTFDGVHVGHQKIINRLLELAREGGETVILTFFPHPRMILHPEDNDLKLISTIEEKAGKLEQAGVDHLIITPFTRDFSNLSPYEYIKTVLVDKIGTKKIVIGYDHRFGKDRLGGMNDLQQYASEFEFSVEEIPEQDINDVAVSSTKIRKSIMTGDIRTANEFLGYPFQLNGKVIKGDQLGRKLGFPTANLYIEESYKLIPADGIYAAVVRFDQEAINGMAYIGHRPTINGMTRNIEVNLFDFNGDLYGKTIRIEFIQFLREDRKFETLDGLIQQLEADEKAARIVLQATKD